MGDKELRIAKLSRLLNSAITAHSSKNNVQVEAYKRAFEDLERSIFEEKLTDEKVSIQRQAQKNIEDKHSQLKKEVNVLHQQMLKKQIEERKAYKDALSRKEKVGGISAEFNGYPNLAPFNNKPQMVQLKGYKEMLDAQLEEKKLIREQRDFEERFLDNYTLSMAKESLDKELTEKISKTKKLQEELSNSWELSQRKRELEKKIEQLRLGKPTRLNQTCFPALEEVQDEGSEVDNPQNILEEIEQDVANLSSQTPMPHKIDIETQTNYLNQSHAQMHISSSAQNSPLSRQQILKRYERIIGKHKRNPYNDNFEAETTRSKSSRRSSVSMLSTVSQKEALIKLKKLSEVEAKIVKEKEDLLKYLEERSEVGSMRAPSRMTTVSKLIKPIEKPLPIVSKRQSVLPEASVKAPQPSHSISKRTKAHLDQEKEEVKSLFSEMFNN
jgi:hypothetical protein